jgi:hypothetical protein
VIGVTADTNIYISALEFGGQPLQVLVAARRGPTSGPGSTPIPLGAPDAPGANMMNGKILLTLSAEPSGTNSKPNPHFFYEYDYVSNSFNQTHAPDGTWSDCGTTDGTYMLDLPDGTILYHPSCDSEPTL